MAMSKGVAMGNIVIGCGLLVLTSISMICGVTAMSKLTGPVAVSIGLWGIYFGIPGVLSIIAGYKKLPTMLGVALGTHVFGIVLAFVGVFIASGFWARLDSNCSTHDEHHYEASCNDLKIVRNATGVVTIIFAVCGLVTLVGSIYGCIGTCGASREPVAIVMTAVPGHSISPANTVVVTGNTQQSQTYGVQQPQAYGMQQPQASGMQQTQAYGIQQPQVYVMQPPPYDQPEAAVQGQVIESKY